MRSRSSEEKSKRLYARRAAFLAVFLLLVSFPFFLGPSLEPPLPSSSSFLLITSTSVRMDTLELPNRTRSTAIPSSHPYRGFVERANANAVSVRAYCNSPERFGFQRSLPLERPDQRIIFVSAKFGHNQRFREDMMKRRKQVMDTYSWCNTSNTYSFYEVPEYLRNHHAYRDSKHTKFLDDPNHESATGAGFWFWKAPLILHHLQELKDGDILVYADLDQTNWARSLTDFVEHMLLNPEIDWALPRWQKLEEQKYTKRDVLEAYCGDNPLLTEDQKNEANNSSQWEAGIHIGRKNARTLQFFQQWELASQNYHALSDEPSYLPNDADFRSHRRDQSLLNMMLKCRFQDLTYAAAPHPCGWRYNGNDRERIIDFYMVSLPPIRPAAELAALELGVQASFTRFRKSSMRVADFLS
jgi:hypothetical protein